MTVPWTYRNVICPFQTASEIRSAVRFCDRIWSQLGERERATVFRTEGPERSWL